MHYINNTYKKIITFITECLTYSLEFCLGRGYGEFTCWGCKGEIKTTHRERSVKCPSCQCWNLHPVWAPQGENPNSFTMKFGVAVLFILFLAVSYGLGVRWLSGLFY